ncbi:protein translocase subunit SecF [Candidatus Woesearchaeota archaeon]|nr:protein translocase subunit SecF [Candidatus Woesearchaeota archaeon]
MEEEHEQEKRNPLLDIYRKRYKALLVIPILLLVLAVVQISMQIASTGDFVNKGVTLKGGVTVTITSELAMDITSIESLLVSAFPEKDLAVRGLRIGGETRGVIIEGSGIDYQEVLAAVERQTGPLTRDQYTVEEMGSSLGESFFREIIIAILIAFVFMAIVVFIYFRNIVPSSAVVLAALSDILVTLAVFNLLGYRLSTAGIAAFLMLIGYSVDTNILLSTRVLKRKGGSVFDRVVGAMGTGLMMSATTLTAIVAALVFTQSEVIRQIMTILLIGLIADLINTWVQNAGILRMYLHKKHVQRENE